VFSAINVTAKPFLINVGLADVFPLLISAPNDVITKAAANNPRQYVKVLIFTTII
jgi:hypothetical protein